MTKKVNTKNIFLSIFIQFVSYLSTLLYTVSYMLLYFLFLFFCFFISTIYFIRDDFLQKNKKNPLSLFRGQKAETEGFEPYFLSLFIRENPPPCDISCDIFKKMVIKPAVIRFILWRGCPPPICQVIGWCYIPPSDTVSSSRRNFTFFVPAALSFFTECVRHLLSDLQ